MVIGGGLVACGGSDDSSPEQDEGSQGSGALSFEPSPGADIPSSEVRLGMRPNGNDTLPVIGIKLGWFDDVGITLPLGDQILTTDQQLSQMQAGDLDVEQEYIPGMIETFASMPDVKHIQTTTSFVGQYFLANPALGAKSWSEFVEEGQSSEEAFTSVMEQLRGRSIAFSTNPGTRPFVNTWLRLGGLTPDDVEIQVLDDSRIVQLAQAGRIDVAVPGGAAQNLQVVDLGFTRIAGVTDLIEGLPQGDPRAVTTFGYAGLAAREDYVEENKETTLRLLSVFNRTIDLIEAQPEKAFEIQAPYMSSATGETITAEDLERLWADPDLDFYEPFNFEKQAELYDESSNLYTGSVSQGQIDAAVEGGVLPADVTPDDLSIAAGLYADLAALKEQYDALLAEGDVPDDPLVDEAAEQYEHRNYLDAYRILKTAVDGGGA